MNRNFVFELFASGAVLGLAILLLNPFDIWMPTMAHMTIVGLVLVACSVFLALVWREQIRDEREGQHRLLAGRAGFMAGIIILTLGITVQSVQDSLDGWLIAALSGMVVVKVITQAYRLRYN